MDYSYIPISNSQLAFSVGLVLLAGMVSAFLKLGLLPSLFWGTCRAFLQLTLIGYVLAYLFIINHFLLLLPIILLMCYIAAREAGKRITKSPHNPTFISFIALSSSTFLVGTIVVVLIISPSPWYTAQVLIPIFGMILGNSMNGIALSLDRMYSEVYGKADQIEALLTFGATPWEAVRDLVKNAVAAGMTPTINSLMVVGLVSLPGMMTGQILAGMDPQMAVRYQFVVMIMIAAAVALGCFMIVAFSFKKLFTGDMALKETVRKN